MPQRSHLPHRFSALEQLEDRRLLASISGFAFLDANRDGLRSTSETGLPGVLMELRSSSGEILQSAVTSDLGFYAFTDLSAGSYRVASQQPEVVNDGLESATFPGVSIGNDEVSNIVLQEQDIASGVNFGEVGLKSIYISAIWVFSSTDESDYGGLLREVVAGGEQVAGHLALATRIRQEATSGATSPPIATTDHYAAVAGETLAVAAEDGILQNDFSPSGIPLEAGLVRSVEGGQLQLNVDGSFTYTANEDFVGVDAFVYKVVGGGESSPITVQIDVAPPPNRTPVAIADAFPLNEDTTLQVDAPGVLANDTDADGDTLAATVVQSPTNGTLQFEENGAFQYVPNANYFGADTFSYIARDDELSSDPVQVQLTILPVNDVPVGVADSYVANEDETLTILAAEGVLANDLDVDGDVLAAIVADDVTNGSLSFVADGSFVYQPNPGFSGFDNFTYIVSDSTDVSEPITVTIDVGAVNDAPVANADTYTTNEDETLSAVVSVLANDDDSDGDPLTASLRQLPSHGSVTLDAEGTFEYVPEPNFHGEDSFTYVANDGIRSSSPATVTILVSPVNDAPVAVADQYGVNQDETLVVESGLGVLANDGDLENDPLTAAIVTQPANGQVVLAANGAFEYTPAGGFQGVDSFSYVAQDGTDDSFAVTVTITVSAVNAAPQANSDAYEADENQTLVIDAIEGVLANDLDSDGDTLSAQLVSQTNNGTVSLNVDGSFSYTPNNGFQGTDEFTYVADDGVTTSAPATVSITVTGGPVTVTETITLGASKDNSLMESPTGALSNGAGEYLFVGRTLQSENFLRRAVIAFDFSALPSDAMVTDVSLTLNMSRTIVEAFDVTLHPVLRDWGEGTSDAAAEEGTGIDSTPGDATWIHAMFDSEAWSTPGGDFDPTASASTSVGGNGKYTWTSAQMVADVQAWLDDPNSNAGWLLLTNEIDTSAKRFDSRENSIAANRPQLVVEYETAAAQGAQVAGIIVDGAEAAEPHDQVFAADDEMLPGDSNQDGRVDFVDFLRLSSHFGQTDAVFADGDFDENGRVDFQDFLLLSQNFGRGTK